MSRTSNEMNSSIYESERESASLDTVGPKIMSNNKNSADESGYISDDITDQLADSNFSGNDDTSSDGNATQRMLFGIRCHILAFRRTKVARNLNLVVSENPQKLSPKI